MNFEFLRRLSQQVIEGDDDRPEWLKTLPGAVDLREPYYKFLRLLAQQERPLYSVEIGTRGGTAALHLAAGNPEGHVLTIDIEPGCAANVAAIAAANGVTNLQAMTADSTRLDPTLVLDTWINLLFIDGDHSYASSYQDYLTFRSFVANGGLIVFDDTRLNDGMTRAWNQIIDPKLEMPELHYMGFGVAIKDSRLTPSPIGA